MYIKKTSRYYSDASGSQATRRQWFLILMSDKTKRFDGTKIRAIVRKVALHQCGHWMMGTARIHGQSITLSGSYGGDGLTTDVPTEVYNAGVPLPEELIKAWTNGGGWNSAGDEGPAVRKWAIENFVNLAPKGARY